MGKNNNDDEYIYSYVHKRMISTRELKGHPRKRKKNIGEILKIVVFLITVTSIFYLIKEEKLNLKMFKSNTMTNPNFNEVSLDNSSILKDEVSELIEYGDSILVETLNMVNYAVGEYNKNNFSKEVVTKLEKDIKILGVYDLSKYSSKKYDGYRNTIEKCILDTKKVLEFLLITKKNTSDNSKILTAYINDGNENRRNTNIKVEEMLRENGYTIEKLENGTIRYYKRG